MRRPHLLLFVLLAVACAPAPDQAVRARASQGQDVTFLNESLPEVYAVASDGKDVYLAATPRYPTEAILRVPATGGAAVTFATQLGFPVALGVDDGHVYYAQPDKLLAFPKGGGAPATLATTTGSIESLTLHGDSIFFSVWQGASTTQIFAVDRAGKKAPSLVATVAQRLGRFAVDDDSVWAVVNATSKLSLVRVGRADGKVTTIAPATRYPYWAGDDSIAADGGHVYFFGEDVAAGFPAPHAAVLAFDVSGQEVRALAILDENVSPIQLAADASNLYWSDYGEDDVYQISKTGSAVSNIGFARCGGLLSVAGGFVFAVSEQTSGVTHETSDYLVRSGIASCKPNTCDGENATCGTIDDGCGGTVQCGTCPTGQSCGGGGTANVCGKACAPAGGACSSGFDCCGSLYCTNGVCDTRACYDVGHACKLGSDCCGDGYCVDGRCSLECRVSGQPCDSSRVDEGGCCSGLLCSYGACTAPGGGGGGGGFGCSSDADCPGGYCGWSATYQTYVCSN